MTVSHDGVPRVPYAEVLSRVSQKCDNFVSFHVIIMAQKR